MTMTLIAKNKLCFVDKSIPQPTNESAPEFKAWICCINMVTTAVEFPIQRESFRFYNTSSV